MFKTKSTLLNKGVFALAVVVVAAIVGGAGFAQAAKNNDTSGYGTNGQQALAAADKLAAACTKCTDQFVAQTKQLTDTAKAQLMGSGAASASDFGSKYDEATANFNSSLDSAFDDFRTNVNNDASIAESKDQFIDMFNHDKADYLNSLDAAKNQFAAVVSNMGNDANVTKDQFMNGFNHDRDVYGNCLESAKNDFAATVSNL